ncbi:MAG: hypothetical protein ACI9F9_000783 [Candidatus Paceibacteria bacterium]|jgi:hypothetical protein
MASGERLTSKRAGQVSRERLLDPILSAAGSDVERLLVCADDLVFLLPLDALPMDEKGETRLGDQVRIVNEVSFARFLTPTPEAQGTASLLALGGVDYNAQGATPEHLGGASAPLLGDSSGSSRCHENTAAD